jgi:hypothetical protein
MKNPKWYCDDVTTLKASQEIYAFCNGDYQLCKRLIDIIIPTQKNDESLIEFWGIVEGTILDYKYWEQLEDEFVHSPSSRHLEQVIDMNQEIHDNIQEMVKELNVEQETSKLIDNLIKLSDSVKIIEVLNETANEMNVNNFEPITYIRKNKLITSIINSIDELKSCK